MRKSLLSVVLLLALAAGFGCSKGSDEAAAPTATPEATESAMPATDDAAMPEGSTSDTAMPTEGGMGDAAPADDTSK